MSETIDNIDKQVSELLEKKKALIASERKNVIKDIKEKINRYDIKLNELGLVAKPTTTVKAKYFNPADKNQQWSGRGRSPIWYSEYISGGGDVSKITIN